MPYTPRKSASLTSTPQSSCSETKRIAVPFGFVFSLFPNISDPCLSKMFEDSYPRVSTSPTGPRWPSASRTSISPDIRVCASSAVRKSFSPAKGLPDLPATGMHASPAERVHASPTERMHASPAERMHDSPAKRMHALPAERVHDSPAKRIHPSAAEGKSVKSESQFVIKYPCCILSSASLSEVEDHSNVTCSQYETENISGNNVVTSQSVSFNPNDSDILHTSDNYGEQTETRASSRHHKITLQAENISQDDVSLNTVEVADSEDFNTAIAANGSNRIPTVHSRIFPKQLFLSAGDTGESVSWHEYESSKSPIGSIHVRQVNFSEISLRNLEATYSGTIVANLSEDEIENCLCSYRSQHKTEYLTENKMPPSRSPSNLVGNYESPAGPLPGASFNVVQASDHMTKGNVLGRSVFSKYAANTKDDPHVSIKYPQDIVALSTSLVKDRSRNYCSHREKESLTESEIPAFQSASNLGDNLEAPIRNSVDEALFVVQTSAHLALTSILRRIRFSGYAANAEIEIDEFVFANETRRLLMRLPENIAHECKCFILHFLHQTLNTVLVG
ncbi:hypothetical protein AVEN_210483-1 [Araneus ventricosus]|uniref:Uncharacterized protein n=1 Tax=Araneus ventricosus TaxID=182803 RepID=A0A4Y2X1I7_ARAVE|nr:hypothetical protein AVEN_210483-1 [Araneus ventricosus]